ncbi:MAG: YgiT-type zinc finger protein [Candidatus Aminicenantes bacterium]|nr:YgiT-type zinc finger protein [Candidatus Aminicenantes bacterium]NIM79149.1 YgiT-type zinc finger protein [Candidatus Aminicenantes bacterium]NIN18434.1 YgiT-type zinc finger protein [Candidatus Aminicenantes bacterium]NIN42322.1 YgiT-type zinc finger protein [Candidatus Aminicenantes bacterium]NIN85088.1 YgiT-type zinc finger protein [Candidatus Aminicenantes bacterium]
MICAACQGKMIRKNGDIDLRINGELYIVHNVPIEECCNCGEKVLDPETSEVIYERVHLKQYKKEKIEIPILDLAVNM